MSETLNSLGMPARLLAEETVLRAIVDVVAQFVPGAKHAILDAAHQRLNVRGPVAAAEAEFYRQAHTAIDDIMQVALEPKATQAARAAVEVRLSADQAKPSQIN